MSPSPTKILLVRFSALGDVVQTIPVLSMLRESFPEAKIGWVTDTEMVPTIEGHPALDYIHACNRRQWTKSLTKPGQWSKTSTELSSFFQEIKDVGYDVAIDAQGLFKSAIVPFAAGIKRRIGYAHGRELSNLFYTEKHVSLQEYFDPTMLHLDHMATLAKAIGAKSVSYNVEPPRVGPEIKEKIESTLSSAFTAGAPIIAIAPATQWESKTWPLEHWVALLDELLNRTSLNVVMVGAKSDMPLVQKILQTFPQSLLQGRVLDLSGKTSIREMYALYEQVDAALGSDSAPLHIAGAVATPHIFGIFGPTAYRRTPPVGSPDVQLFSTEIGNPLVCQPCRKSTCPLGTKECMISVKPKELFLAIERTLCANGATSRTGGHRIHP